MNRWAVGRQVSYQKLLRIFILTDVFAMVGVVIAAVIFEGTLPEPLRTYAATQESHPLVLIAAVILLVLLIVAWIGLWRGAAWAPVVYAVMWFSCVAVVPFSGPYVGTGMEEMFDFVGTSAGGGILALAFLAMQERRKTGLATLEGGEGEAAIGALSEAGRSDRSDEQLQPHLKSRRVHLALSWLYIIALMLLALPFVARSGEEGLPPGDVARALVFPLFFFVLAALHHVVSRGARERKRWARIGSIVLACLLLPGVPVGTLIGVYLLRNSSWQPRAEVALGG